MKAFQKIVPVLLAAAVGCSTVREAKDAQKESSRKGDDAAVAAADGRVDLRGYSLEKLVAFAMTNRPSVVSARLAVEDARLALRQLAADAPLVSETPWTAPKLSLSGAYSERSPGGTINEGMWRTEKGNPSASLSLDVLIWDFGRYNAKAKAQGERVLAAEQSLLREGYQVFGAVTTGFFDYLEKRALLDVAFTNEAQYAAHLRRAQDRFDTGEANRLNVLRARLDLATARQATIAASNAVATSGATLMCALGIDASRGSCAEVLGEGPISGTAVYRAFPRTAGSAAEAFAFARTNAPAMRVARANVRAASYSVDYAIADLLPTFSVSASLSWTDPLWAWGWGLSAAQSLFQGFRRTTAVDRAVVELKKAAAAVDAAEQTLSVDLETAIAVRDNSARALESAWVSVQTAAENLSTVREQFALGEASRIELSDAIAADSRARGDCITAFYAGQRAEAALYRIVGRYPVYHEEIVKEEKK